MRAPSNCSAVKEARFVLLDLLAKAEGGSGGCRETFFVETLRVTLSVQPIAEEAQTQDVFLAALSGVFLIPGLSPNVFPIIEYVLPEPVCPYIKTVPFMPSTEASTMGLMLRYSNLLEASGPNTVS